MPMVITDTPQKPFDKVHMDIVGPLPESNYLIHSFLAIVSSDSFYGLHNISRTESWKSFITVWISPLSVRVIGTGSMPLSSAFLLTIS